MFVKNNLEKQPKMRLNPNTCFLPFSIVMKIVLARAEILSHFLCFIFLFFLLLLFKDKDIFQVTLSKSKDNTNSDCEICCAAASVVCTLLSAALLLQASYLPGEILSSLPGFPWQLHRLSVTKTFYATKAGLNSARTDGR